MKSNKFIEAVNHPSHYKLIPIAGQNGVVTDYEAIDIISAVVENLKLSPSASYSVGNALKYILRAGKKESDNSTADSLQEKAAQDLMKGAWYLNNAAEKILADIQNKDVASYKVVKDKK